LKKFFQRIDGAFIVDLLAGHPQPKTAWLQRLWLALLYIGGLFLWGRFLNWGRGPVNFHDWGIIFGPRLAFLREAIIRGDLPLHLSVPAVEDGVTLRFLSSPDQILSPQIFLLPWLDVGHFVLLQYFFLFSLGAGALLLLRRRFELSLLAFTILFALFSFNGHILAHASVGHANWAGYFLYTAFAVLIFDLLDGQANWRWVAKVAFLSLFIVLQGSYHQFIYMLFFLGLLALSSPRYFWWIAAASGFAVLVTLARTLPAGLLMGQVDSDFISGYPSVQAIWTYLTQVQFANDKTISGGLIKPTGTWEFTVFVGILAALFILYFGVVRTLTDRETPYHFQVVLVPCLGLTFLSLDRVFFTLRSVAPLPLFTGERVAARIFSLAFVFILIGATVLFQRWLDKNRPTIIRLVAILLLLALAAYDLLTNMRLWSVMNIAERYPTEDFVPSRYFPVNQYNDTPYLALLAISLVLSIASAGVLLYLAWREKRKLIQSASNG